MIKSISSGDYVLIEEKYKAAKDVSLFCTMFFGCNKLPKTSDTSHGFYRRFTIIPFIANLSAVTPVDGMAFKKKLLMSESLEYVAYKAVEAIRNVMNNTRAFTEPKTVTTMMEQYRRDNSTVLSWFADLGITKADADKMGFNLLWTKYKTWCASSGRPNLSQTNFKNTLKTELGIDKFTTV
jgi:putative DNA primase/helicase